MLSNMGVAPDGWWVTGSVNAIDLNEGGQFRSTQCDALSAKVSFFAAGSARSKNRTAPPREGAEGLSSGDSGAEHANFHRMAASRAVRRI